jgi:hypothetical protein
VRYREFDEHCVFVFVFEKNPAIGNLQFRKVTHVRTKPATTLKIDMKRADPGAADFPLCFVAG